MARLVKQRRLIAADLALFIACDVADGLIARHLDCESPMRRAVDAVADRTSMAIVLSAIARVNRSSRPYIIALAGRYAAVDFVNISHFLRTNEVTHGSGLHRLGTLSIATFSAAAGHSETATHIAGASMVAINAGLALDYFDGSQSVEEDGIRHLPAFESIKELFSGRGRVSYNYNS